MSDEAYQAPAEAAAAAAKPLARAAGGKPLSPMDVLNGVLADLQGNPVGWLLAGLGYLLVLFGVVFVAIGALGLAVVPGVLMEDETVLAVGLLAGVAIYMATLMAFAFVLTPLMNAALLRAIGAARADERPLGFGSSLSGLFHDAGRVIVFNLLGQLLILCGLLLFYVPGLIAAALVTFTLPIVVFEPERSPTDALQKGFEHMKADPAFHLGTFALLFVAVLIAEFTLVGLLFLGPLMAAFQYHAYQVAFAEPKAA